VLLVLLIVIDFEIKILISRNNLFPTYVTNWCQKREGGLSKSQSFELPHKICSQVRESRALPPVVTHGYLMITCGLLCIPPLAVLLSVFCWKWFSVIKTSVLLNRQNWTKINAVDILGFTSVETMW